MSHSKSTGYWSDLRAAGSALSVPAAILELQNAKTVEQAENSYWRIDNTVIVQGMLFEAARPTASLLVAALPICTLAARPRILELLVQLGSGEPSPPEVLAGNLSIARECRQEVCCGFSLYQQWLNNVGEEELVYCVDLLGLCALENQRHKEQVKTSFLALVEKPNQRGNLQLITNWINKLAE